ncbi:MAG: SUMF1/EgtB/PvdO family nonheme iron enzyme, partial [Chloroflexi bacterium]|nr:SUMF1/EgtB/PvdO family nonheme iron enzyme [Chloroflexota bacterium]
HAQRQQEKARLQQQQEEARAQKRREEELAQRKQTEAAQLYARLRTDVDKADWDAALTLADQIETLLPGYRDVKQLAARARRGQKQDRRAGFTQTLRQLPIWGWIGGLVVVALAVFGVFQLINGDGGEATITPTTSATLQSTDTSQPTNTPMMTPASALAPGIGSARIRPKDEAVMVYVPGGTFMMGSSNAEIDKAFEICEQALGSGECQRSWFERELPQHLVSLDSFWIDQTEVTNGMYAQCVDTGVCRPPEVNESYTRSSYYGNIEFDNFPVIEVSWEDAKTYCEWVDGRLPTEAEWEKASRWDENAQEAYTYPWGNDFDGTRLNFCDSSCPFDGWKDDTVNDGYEDTAPVGSYPEGNSPYGALDMAGNVWEWTADWYNGEYYKSSPGQNPQGPDN